MRRIIPIILLSLVIISCKKKENNDKSVNIFSIEDDKALGLQVSQQIESDSSEYIVLEPTDFPDAYNHLNRIRNTILDGGNVYYRDELEWRTRIIYDDSTLNAFCTPGGYIYVFTGLIHYLDSEDQLAGVLGHEIAHADRRHSTDQMTKQYGISVLIAATLGDSSAIGNIAAGLLLLKYSRNNESEADEYSVRYLCPTDYNAAGGAGFFEKIEADGGSTVPEFLSTHPSPDKRIETFYNWQDSLGCSGQNINVDLYQQFKNSLP